MEKILTEWRERKNLRPIDAAKLLGVTIGMWSRWENGLRPVPATRLISFEKITGIKNYELRPDVVRPPKRSRPSRG